MLNMGKFRLKIASSIAFLLNARSSNWITFGKETREWTTIDDLLRD